MWTAKDGKGGRNLNSDVVNVSAGDTIAKDLVNNAQLSKLDPLFFPKTHLIKRTLRRKCFARESDQNFCKAKILRLVGTSKNSADKRSFL